jgi:hypothetical protein
MKTENSSVQRAGAVLLSPRTVQRANNEQIQVLAGFFRNNAKRRKIDPQQHARSP